jgi:2'-5' RNA ligase
MPRLFTALEIPAHIGDGLSMLRGGLPGARWIDPEFYHLTLRFIGDVDDSVAREAAFILGQVKRDAFEVKIDGLSSFGGRRPRAVVAIAAPNQPLLDLQGEHERLLRRIGLEPEGRKYMPHVTLARLRVSSSQQVAEYLSTRGHFRCPPFEASRFVLFSSRDSVGGGPYVVEADYPLAASMPRALHAQR